MNNAFRNQTVLITGAAGGLGAAVSMRLAEAGADLLLLDKNPGGLDVLHDRILGAGLAAPGICPLDLGAAGPKEYGQLVPLLEKEYGGLDHLLHCAAEFQGLSPLDQVQPTDWLRCMQANLNAAWLLTAQCLPLLRQSGNPTITFVLEREDISSSAYWGAYGISKSALRHLAQMFATELEGSGVRVIASCPGPMRTALRARAYLAENPGNQADPEQVAREVVARIRGDNPG